MTKPSDIVVRDAIDEYMDAETAVYAHHVQHGLGSFEEEPPSAGEMARRRQGILDGGLPYLVAENEGAISGYAYAGPFRPRPAYRHTVENSVYVAPDAGGRGVGRSLLSALIERCTDLGYRQMVSMIGDTQNVASINLHAALGFHRAGLVTAPGFKGGRWVDVVIMQRPLGDGDSTIPGP